MSERTYRGLDEALVPLHQHLQMLMPRITPLLDPESRTGMTIAQVELSMPIEIDILPEPGGEVSVGLSPPLYYVETGFESARHRLRVTIVEESQLLPRMR